jgi:phosphatidylinositol alpha-1,6-mannosyltransferase
VNALLVTNDFPPAPGGESTWYAAICAALPPSAVTVLAPRMPGDRAVDAALPYRVIRRWAPAWPYPLSRFVQIALFTAHAGALARRQRASAVHVAHLYLGPVGFALWRLRRTPYVLYLHGGEMAPFMRFRTIRAAVSAIIAGAQQVVMNSTFTRRHYAAFGIEHPHTEILTIGVDTVRFRPDVDASVVRRRLGLDGARVILTVGRLVERKGHDTVIRALPRVRDAVGPVRYVIAGAGPEASRLTALARESGCEADVVFAGRVPEEELPAYYAACDVFIMPSRELPQRDGVEGFGIVFLEAGACGRPVIGGRSGGIADAVLDGTTGRLVDPLSVSEVADALIRMLQDPDEAERLGRAGRARAEALEAAWRSRLASMWLGPPAAAD